MLSRKADEPPVVRGPGALADRPSWVKVGVIAAVGFVVGIAWPRIAGLKLGPSVPEAASVTQAATRGSESAATGLPATPPSMAAVTGVATSGATATAPPSLAPTRASPPASSKDTGSGVGEGDTEVVWPVALIRDAPKNGQVIARLPHGARVRIGAAKDGWYPIKYGEDFGSEGWVYRGAIGK